MVHHSMIGSMIGSLIIRLIPLWWHISYYISSCLWATKGSRKKTKVTPVTVSLGYPLSVFHKNSTLKKRKTQRVFQRHTLRMSFLTTSIVQGENSHWHVELFLVGRRKRWWYMTRLQMFGSFPRPWHESNTNTFPRPTEIPNHPPVELLPLTGA
jgi:hypothetical protein